MDEAEARRAIVMYGKRIHDRGLVAGSSGNISVLLDDGRLIVTPTARSLGFLDADDLVCCTRAGTSLDAERRPTSELPLHIAAYRARPDVRCVIHTHPSYCVSWSKTGRLFPLDTVGAMESLGVVAFTPYARSGTQELADLCAAAFAGNVDTIVMERHGLSCVGAELEAAYLHTDLAEQTAHIEFAAFVLSASKL